MASPSSHQEQIMKYFGKITDLTKDNVPGSSMDVVSNPQCNMAKYVQFGC